MLSSFLLSKLISKTRLWCASYCWQYCLWLLQSLLVLFFWWCWSQNLSSVQKVSKLHLCRYTLASLKTFLNLIILIIYLFNYHSLVQNKKHKFKIRNNKCCVSFLSVVFLPRLIHKVSNNEKIINNFHGAFTYSTYDYRLLQRRWRERQQQQ